VSACGGQGVSETEFTTTTVVVNTTRVAETTSTSEATGTLTPGGAEGPLPCDIASPEMVEAAYGGTVGEGIEGYADNCTYWLGVGARGAVQKVDVFYLGVADDWDDIVRSYGEGGGGVIEVEGIGDRAFHPKYHGVRDLFFQHGGQVYSIVSFGGPTDEDLVEVEDAVLSLAAMIMDAHE
jgi:hypothetical protein